MCKKLLTLSQHSALIELRKALRAARQEAVCCDKSAIKSGTSESPISVSGCEYQVDQINSKLAEIENILRDGQIIEEPKGTSLVQVNLVVTLEIETIVRRRRTFLVTGYDALTGERDPGKGIERASYASPLIAPVMGKKCGFIADIFLPREGHGTAKVLKIQKPPRLAKVASRSSRQRTPAKAHDNKRRFAPAHASA